VASPPTAQEHQISETKHLNTNLNKNSSTHPQPTTTNQKQTTISGGTKTTTFNRRDPKTKPRKTGQKNQIHDQKAARTPTETTK
jgi:hypothetical protein